MVHFRSPEVYLTELLLSSGSWDSNGSVRNSFQPQVHGRRKNTVFRGRRLDFKICPAFRARDCDSVSVVSSVKGDNSTSLAGGCQQRFMGVISWVCLAWQTLDLNRQACTCRSRGCHSVLVPLTFFMLVIQSGMRVVTSA